MRKAVFLDRDGVLNKTIIYQNTTIPPYDLSQLKLTKNIEKNLKILKNLNYLLIVITNQPDVARGTQKKSNVLEINDFLKKKLKLDDIFICWHGKDGVCDCRKPMPGLILKAKKKYNISLNNSFMIGDRETDVKAGYNAGCMTILVKNPLESQIKTKANYFAHNIKEAVDWIKLKN